MEGKLILKTEEVNSLKALSQKERFKFSEERSTLSSEITELKSQIETSLNSTAIDEDDKAQSIEDYAKFILKETQNVLNRCQTDMETVFKMDDEVDDLRGKLEEKDLVIGKLQKEMVDQESKMTKINIQRNEELEFEKVRESETIYKMSLNNS